MLTVEMAWFGRWALGLTFGTTMTTSSAPVRPGSHEVGGHGFGYAVDRLVYVAGCMYFVVCRSSICEAKHE